MNPLTALSPRRGSTRSTRALRFVTFLAPKLLPLYQHLVRAIGQKLERPVELAIGLSYDQLDGETDVAFLCGLAYVELAKRTPPGPPLRRGGEGGFEPLVAPVLQGPRYQGKPIYYSDVIVQRNSPFRQFADLRGYTWAYNEPLSQSGSGIVRYNLARTGNTNGFFSRVVQTGWHEQAIQMVYRGTVHGAAIDSHVLAVVLRDRRDLVRRLRIIESFGPSTIQPVVVSRRLSPSLKNELRQAFLELHSAPGAGAALTDNFVERFVPVIDADYDDIRAMRAASKAVVVE